ncbi:hypothetical protein [Kineosporia sp. NBRC 101731]|uniref:tetratricopeptide repeat protein n=1 Tax=Kineosporia sp. NBRC 101731 TaxID=3032199 RepID=UPI0024A27729|nr:hypothetical protein [Kineosporia sp. NBRC 101731]GLY28228.1 hypothetical protein Kisp02_15930 [Kineosporia sp. NBRC 101731]
MARWVPRNRRIGLRAARTIYWRPSFLMLGAMLVLSVVVLVFGVLEGPDGVAIEKVGQAGLEHLTGGSITVNRIDLAVLGVLLLFLVRRARLDWLTIRPGPVEVRPVEDASQLNLDDDRLRRYNVELREALAGSQLYETTSVPGDLETERIIEVFRDAQAGGRVAVLGAVWTFLWPARSFVVTATLRNRPEEPKFGVSVTVRRLPRPGVELDTYWSGDFDRALQRAAFAVTAHILPQTRACDRPPWGQWRNKSRDRPMPMELMRHYQRAKRMVAERRYDEALSLYHDALLFDADNVYLQFDVGQIFERLHLYPDAVRLYALLTNRLFPLTDPHDGTQGRSMAFTRPTLHDDPFMVRYRYVGGLTTGSRLARELLMPDWKVLRDWLQYDFEERTQGRVREGRHFRPWRSTELADIRTRLAGLFDEAWKGSLPENAALYGQGLAAVLVEDPRLDTDPGFWTAPPWQDLAPRDARVLAVEEYFLHVAGLEMESLRKDFEMHPPSRRTHGPRSSLTMVVLGLMDLLIVYRKRRFRPAGLFGGSITWPPRLEEMTADLRDRAGYRADSQRWLEHYVAACFLALPLEGDTAQIDQHVRFAEAAVAALERAQECGDEVDFVTSKRYWLLAGDPDLAGLRQYDCFRAFEARVYRHPQPPAVNPARYELFHYMRLGLAQSSEIMESLWLQRVNRDPATLSPRNLERWFRMERRAWEMVVRLSRFHQQWQTRSAALEGLRGLARYLGTDARPVPFPEMARDYYSVGVNTPEYSQRRIDGMEELFTFLGRELGPAAALDPEQSDPDEPMDFVETETPMPAQGDPLTDLRRQGTEFAAPVIPSTRAWIWHAENCSRGVPGTEFPLSQEELGNLCRAWAAVWAALRQRATTPARRADTAFVEAVRRLPVPPAARVIQLPTTGQPARQPD